MKDLLSLAATTVPLPVVYRCHMFFKLLRYYTSSPLITDQDPMIHLNESTIVFWLLDTKHHYVQHPHHYLHRYKYCLRCKALQRLKSPESYNPELLVERCNKCLPLEGRERSGIGHIHFRATYNPMIAVLAASDLEFRKTLDLVLESYL